MNRLSILMLILLSFTSISIAQQPTKQYDNPNIERKTANKKKRVESYMMVQHFIINAEKLDLTYYQRQQIENIKQDYLYPMIQKEADFQISNMKVMDLLKEADFEPKKIKVAIEKSINLSLENALMSIDALAAIRKAVGVDNFNKLRTMMNLTPSEMQQYDDENKNNQEQAIEQNRSL